MPAVATIKEPTLRELAETDSIRSVRANGQLRGFALLVDYGRAERKLVTARGEARLFSNLTTLACFLRKLGIERFEVDTTHYQPGRIRPPRPDRAAALRKTRTRPRQPSLELSTGHAS